MKKDWKPLFKNIAAWRSYGQQQGARPTTNKWNLRVDRVYTFCNTKDVIKSIAAVFCVREEQWRPFCSVHIQETHMYMRRGERSREVFLHSRDLLIWDWFKNKCCEMHRWDLSLSLDLSLSFLIRAYLHFVTSTSG